MTIGIIGTNCISLEIILSQKSGETTTFSSAFLKEMYSSVVLHVGTKINAEFPEIIEKTALDLPDVTMP